MKHLRWALWSPTVPNLLNKRYDRNFTCASGLHYAFTAAYDFLDTGAFIGFVALFILSGMMPLKYWFVRNSYTRTGNSGDIITLVRFSFSGSGIRCTSTFTLW